MNIKTIWQVGISLIRNIRLKITRGKSYCCHWLYSCPIETEIRIHKGGNMSIGKHLSAQKDLLLSVLPEGQMSIGDNVNFNTDCSVVARQSIKIGDNVIFGPGCKVYDHDHDYSKKGMKRRTSFITGSVNIGNGVWFGANCIILRGTVIGDNCVFGAGSIIKGNYPADTLVVQERTEKQKLISFEE